MEMNKVDSSMIDSIGYDQGSSTMVIVFRNGHVYEFHMIPLGVYEEFLRADSKGKFFMERLKFSRYGRRRTKLE
jgi:hypothetical protein